ncbi:hypothetical protein [Actinoallomurus vinaceus]
MHGDDDQIVRYAAANGRTGTERTLKTYEGFPHGMPTTQADTINAGLLAFVRS